MRQLLLFSMLVLFSISAYSQQTVHYDLFVNDTIVNYTGNERKAISINGSIPGPILHFTEGDTAVIDVHNNMHHETSVHWHGLLVPNEQDGVSYLTTAPIEGHSTHQFKFVLKQSGTYWYHSHTMLQEQSGMYGAIVIHKRNAPKENEEVVLLSDWTDENPHEVERSLHYGTDWYTIKKDAAQSYAEALRVGHFKTKLVNEWKRMHSMDVSDVYYNKFIVNGRNIESRPQYKPGDKVHLRIINGSSSTYFWISYSGGKMDVVASDGMDVVPTPVDRFIVGVSETYDITVTIPEQGGAYEFLATSEDRIGSTSFWLGSGEKHPQKALPKLKYFEGMEMMNDMMTVGGNMKDMGMEMSLQKMDMNQVMYPELSDDSEKASDTQNMRGMNMDTNMGNMQGHKQKGLVTLNYSMLKSPVSTTLPDVPTKTLRFELTGNMNRYVWTINNKTVSENDRILIKRGENTRIILTNNSMMRHPMHLHGHFFRVINGQGEYSPLKTVIDIMPMETDTIEFHGSEQYGNWFFHCHILYHMMSGMGRVFSYEDSPPNPQLPDPIAALKKVYADDRRFFTGAEIGLESNGSTGNLSMMNTRWIFTGEWQAGINNRRGFEANIHLGRYLDNKQFLMAYVGWDWEHRKDQHKHRSMFGQYKNDESWGAMVAGLEYTFPFWIVADLQVNHRGHVNLQLKRDDVPITKRLRLWGMLDTDRDYSFGAKYIITKYISGSTFYDNNLRFGAGVRITY